MSSSWWAITPGFTNKWGKLPWSGAVLITCGHVTVGPCGSMVILAYLAVLSLHVHNKSHPRYLKHEEIYVRQGITDMYSHCYEQPHELMPWPSPKLPHILHVFKPERPDSFQEELCVLPTTFDNLLKKISSDSVFIYNSPNMQTPIAAALHPHFQWCTWNWAPVAWFQVLGSWFFFFFFFFLLSHIGSTIQCSNYYLVLYVNIMQVVYKNNKYFLSGEFRKFFSTAAHHMTKYNLPTIKNQGFHMSIFWPFWTKGFPPAQ